MSRIPYHILSNIVEKLDVKSLVRFKTMNKECQNYINNSNFIKQHLNNSLQHPTEFNTLLIFTSAHSLYLVDDLRSLSPCPIKLSLPPAFQHVSPPTLVGSCNGLVCISSGVFQNNYFLFNPTNPTAVKILPVADNDISRYGYSSRCISVGSAFGYDEKNDDYKIVYIWYRRDSSDDLGVQGMIYSLKLGSWKLLDPPAYVGGPWTYIVFAFLNNCLHFYTNGNDVKVIISFNLHDEEWSQMNFPDLDETYEVNDVFVLEGCLSTLIVIRQQHCFYQQLWVMKEYGVTESWTRLLIFPLSCTSLVSLNVLFYSKRLKRYLLSSCVTEENDYDLYWYNEVDGYIEEVKIQGDLKIHGIQMVIPSLVPIGCRRLKARSRSEETVGKTKGSPE